MIDEIFGIFQMYFINKSIKWVVSLKLVKTLYFFAYSSRQLTHAAVLSLTALHILECEDFGSDANPFMIFSTSFRYSLAVIDL